ncbi:MAG: SUMF1/EgtB/PvdO family nonheme iron enzyme [Planctomycetes bacterium]|nr:SUMF1/EgtB/PvdO family nonheme iron enzyme [Planctomycetota bacterium]
MYCHHCGQQVIDGARFCNHCGGGLVTGGDLTPPRSDRPRGFGFLEMEAGPGLTPPPATTPPPFPAGTLSGQGMTQVSPGPASSSWSALALQPGAVIHDRYRIEDCIGSGGMGLVFRVDDPRSGETLCLKVIRPDLVASSSIAERFRNEGLMTRKLRHPGIVAVHDVYVGSDLCFITMEHLEGRTLRRWIDERRRAGEETSLATAAGIVGSILDGLGAAHVAGVVHRDLKPENVMLLGEPLEGDFRSKIMDFGIARALAGDSALTLEGAVIGTRGYMAPEQEFGGGAVGPQADVYACGAILYELLCEIVPAGRWLDPTEVRPDLEPAIDQLMKRVLAQHPRVRTGSAAEFGRALRTLVAATSRAEAGPSAAPKGGSAAAAKAPEPPTSPASSRPRLVMPDWAEPIPGDPWSSEAGDRGFARAVRDRQTGIELLLVPAGSYRRGASPGDEEAWPYERPAHHVTITRPFYLGRYPVTQEEWRGLTGERPSRFTGDRRPVEQVSWTRVMKALEGTGLRLPTEAEWEYAARAGCTEARYGKLDEIAWHGGNSGGKTQPVGDKRPNPWGFHDLLGIVLEWCADCFENDEYERCKGGVVDPIGPNGGLRRVLRGGSWLTLPAACRLSARDGIESTGEGSSIGFRVARTP